MQINKDDYREFLLWIFGNIQKLEGELIAHQVVFFLLKSTGQFPELDKLLEEARKNPPPKLSEKYAEIRNTIDKILDEANLDQELMKFLREWKPTGPTN